MNSGSGLSLVDTKIPNPREPAISKSPWKPVQHHFMFTAASDDY
jgi:hypothetical protein